ncbi:bifunctional folylpolyglutamate synthase/dihydrofolate synthase [Olivibacter domesticus]|uniref:Dihydrofolate synthase/folylpolyglutamate synthase n=1 Tax=Olivibacter domesticus TaxID=407022 RepID=A0A1H7U7J6_OLID1|nr:folylpolyglutamate synthase/dihydrofolate synthase family protein [Olivibacter domesticus]SEL92963.1 dihydrofolate synthase / folylpolyglutamate synthase [Olivibacter domesticus]
MNYIEVIDYLYSRLPMFTRDGSSAFKKDLTNIRKFCEALENPQQDFKAIHIAGTNGKGSTSHMLAAVLQSAGYKTGLYTSPHLLDFRERIKVNGEMIPQQVVVDFVKRHKSLIEEIRPSFFEVTVAIAFYYFSVSKVDVAIIETGLGGRLDSTNIIQPVLSVITNIGFDHMNMLGNTLTEIAHEKAGIIKANTPIIISERQSKIDTVFTEYAHRLHAPITFASDQWSIRSVELHPANQQIEVLSNTNLNDQLVLSLDLKGSYQQKNVLGVLTAIHQLNQLGFNVDQQTLIKSLASVQQLTGLMGRWQTLSSNPLTICDTGHNEDGWQEVLNNIQLTAFNNLHMVIGVMRDKDLDHMLTLLPKNATYYYCSPPFERALPADELQVAARNFGLTGSAYDNVIQAIKDAQMNAAHHDLIFIGGSTFVVAEALPLFITK